MKLLVLLAKPSFMLLIFLSITSFTIVNAQVSKTWSPSTTNTTDWNLGANWIPSGVPTATSDITINIVSSGRQYPVIPSTGAVCGTLKSMNNNTSIGAGGILTITNSGTLNIATGSAIISCGLNLNANTTFTLSAGRALTIDGNVSGPGSFIKAGTGTVYLSSLNNLLTSFEITNGTLNLNGKTTVNGNLKFTGGNFFIGGGTLVANGTISYTLGTLNGDLTSTLELGGTTDKNLSFGLGGKALYNLKLAHSSSATTMLNTSLDIYGGITFGSSNDILDLNGTGVDPDGGNVTTTLKSDGNGTSYIGNLNGATLNGATNVTIERYIPANGFRSWRLLSVPTYGSGQTIRQAWQEGDANSTPMVSPTNTVVEDNVPGYGTQITLKVASGYTSTDVNNAYNAGFDNVTYNTAIQLYNNSTYAFDNVTNTSTTPIATTSGYFLYVRGDRTKGVTGSSTDASATTLRTSGTVYQGTFTSPTIAANKYAVIGNLYPSRIDFSSLPRTGGVDNAFYVWDSKIHSGNSLGVYQAFSGTNNYLCPIGGGSYTQGVTNITIESGQAFFVHTTGSAGTVTLTEASKTGLGNTLGLRPATPTSQLVKIDSRLFSLNITDTTIADANVVVFNNSYSNSIDGDDAYKFSNAGENFGIKRNGSTLVIEGRQALSTKDTIFFNMWNMQQHKYKLEFEPMNLGSIGYMALLQDSYLNTDTPVDLSAMTDVNFTVDGNAASFAADRFKIVFAPAASLPVNFLSVAANPAGSGVKVDWEVAGEVNLRSYEVERSTDGSTFTTVASVKATGNSNTQDYSWTDLNVPAGVLYYRIKSIGVSGENKYSTTVKVNRGNAGKSIVISPNPVDGNMINLQFNNKVQGKYSIRMLNIAGQSLFSTVTNHAGGTGNHSLAIPAGCKKGTYLLEITAPDRMKTVQKLIYGAN